MTAVDASYAELPNTVAVIRRGIEEGLHLGAQVYVSVRGEPVADFAVGEARPGEPLTPNSILLWMSSTKPVGALAVGQLLEHGQLSLDDPIARYIPEFGVKGKGPVTIRNLLTHTGGFRNANVGDVNTPWGETISRICNAPLEDGWIVGETAGYHPESSWFILGELVRRVDGRPFEDYVRQRIFEPLGMLDSWVGMPPGQYEFYGERVAPMFNTRVAPPTRLPLTNEAHATRCVPGASGFGPMHELGKLYETLLAGLQSNETPVLRPATIGAMARRARQGKVDRTWGQVMDWGLGFIVNSRRYGPATPYGYGDYASDSTFGHSGAQSSSAFADPGRDLVAAYVFNGMPGEPKHQRRVRQITNAIYQDLGIAGSGPPAARP